MSRSRLLLFRAGATALVGVALAFSLYRTVDTLSRLSGPPWGAGELASLLRLVLVASGTPAAASLALALAWRSCERAESRALAAFLALLAYTMAGDGIWLFAVQRHLPRLAAGLLATSVPVAGILSIAAFLRFSALFPRPLGPADLPAGGGGRLAAVLRRVHAASLGPGSVWRGAALLVALVLAAQAAGAWGDATGRDLSAVRLLKPVVVTALVGWMVLGVANLRAGYGRADEVGRRQIFWVLEGFLAGTAILLVTSALKLVQMASGYSLAVAGWFDLSVYAAFLVVLACLAVAMFRAGALDPSLAIRRTAVFGLVGATMIFVFAGVEQSVQELLGAWLGLGDRSGGMLTGGIVALTFEPVKARATALVERMLGRAEASGPVPPALSATSPGQG
jgi:hypothetical protein